MSTLESARRFDGAGIFATLLESGRLRSGPFIEQVYNREERAAISALKTIPCCRPERFEANQPSMLRVWAHARQTAASMVTTKLVA